MYLETQKSDFGGSARFWAIGLSIGSKGYIGLGYDTTYKSDFWEYDPSVDRWNKKTDYSGTPVNSTSGFSIENKGFIGTGYYSESCTNEFWEYDQLTDSWTRKADYSGNTRACAVRIFNWKQRLYRNGILLSGY